MECGQDKTVPNHNVRVASVTKDNILSDINIYSEALEIVQYQLSLYPQENVFAMHR